MPPLQPILSSLRQPLLADLLQPRIGAITIAGTAALQLLAATHGMGLPCPFHDYLGIPCPGCGLTRSLLALAHGNLLDSLAWHPYGILLAASLAAATAAALLPTTPLPPPSAASSSSICPSSIRANPAAPARHLRPTPPGSAQ